MDWSWAPFIVGVVVGVTLMWIAVVVAQAREAEEFDRKWR